MSQPPYRYLLMDLDGTLLDSRSGLSARNAAALHRATAVGWKLVLASGRTYHSLLRVTEPLDLPPFHLIANGGAVALTPGGAEVRYLNSLPAALWREVAGALTAEGLAPVVFAHRHPSPPQFHVTTLDGNPHHALYVRRNAHLCRVHGALDAAGEIPDVVEVAALGRDEEFQAASSRVMARFEGRARCHSMVLRLQGQWGLITEFFAPGTSKWRALEGLFPDAAAHPEAVVAIGDEANDLEMITAAGLGIAMGNAIDGLKTAADAVTADHDHDGVALALEGLLG